jgi:hypothetical protein
MDYSIYRRAGFVAGYKQKIVNGQQALGVWCSIREHGGLSKIMVSRRLALTPPSSAKVYLLPDTAKKFGNR